jgi:putative hydrolase of the HAD superfamily
MTAPRSITTIGLDADDTLWHNEDLFHFTEQAFAELLAPYGEEADLRRALFETETRNLARFGYGVKAFTLSMIETAITVSNGRIDATGITQLLDCGKAMLDRPAELLPGVADTVRAMARNYQLVVITKGDLHHQQTKVANCGIAELFDAVEIVTEKDVYTYEQILARHSVAPDSFVMVGNSMKSDILPVVELGGHGVHIPYRFTWAHELVDAVAHDRAFSLQSITELPDLVERIATLPVSARNNA